MRRGRAGRGTGGSNDDGGVDAGDDASSSDDASGGPPATPPEPGAAPFAVNSAVLFVFDRLLYTRRSIRAAPLWRRGHRDRHDRAGPTTAITTSTDYASNGLANRSSSRCSAACASMAQPAGLPATGAACQHDGHDRPRPDEGPGQGRQNAVRPDAAPAGRDDHVHDRRVPGRLHRYAPAARRWRRVHASAHGRGAGQDSGRGHVPTPWTWI